ncbi:histone acetyltransferase HAC1-like isoform X1 [Cynara cardunculus var. scolymus]|uniref:histone acetyltransferase HAC1-like isoform X1 n=3 Tax=Cynara cardunculus var. scolymus TaxID=59895 RepID=UPI000D629CA2|nr:histone acetyltransferase HAC1-like isoform X1 [Cynara cardunculus var. scolymus]XP_024976552.1 histone acetyltransferase HAC1-like isoform X1 [Cynara cardunculus var. scolymus]
MNLQAQMSGQFSRQVSSQAGTSLPAIPQQQNMMQNSEGPHAPLNMEPGFVKTRRFIQDRIYESLMQRQQTREIAPKNVLDIVRRLEEGLFKTATTKEEYMNLETLETRLQVLIRRLPLNNQNQRYQQQSNSSVAIGTMIPTPGVPQSGNSNLMVPSSRDSSLIGPGGGNSMVSSAVNAGSFSLNTTGPSRGMLSGSFGSEGGLTDGGQQSLSNFSVSSGGNSLISSTGAQRMASQMMPTPGYNNTNSTSNQSYMKMESSSNVSVLSSVDSIMVSQPLQQKQQVGGQNSRILHSLGSHMGGGIRSTLNQNAYGFPNGSLNGNLGMMGKSSQPINSLGTSEGFLRDTRYGNSAKPVPQYFDQHQGQMSQGDGYGSGTADSGRSGNFYTPTTSATSLMNINPVNLPALQGTNPPLVVNHSSLHNADQPVNMKHSIDQSEEMDFRSQHLLRESAVHSQQPLHFQQQLLQSQRQQKQQNQRLPYGQSQLISDLGGRIKAEPGMERHNETLQPQAYGHFQSSQATNCFQQNSGEDHTRASQLHSLSSGSQDMCLSMTETSEQQQQLLQQPHFGVDTRNDLMSSIGIQPEAVLQGQWHSRSQEASHELGNLSNELRIQEEFRQEKRGHDQGQRNNLSSESMNHQMAAKRSVDPPDTGAVCRSANSDRGLQYRNQKRWLLFLIHARKCAYPPGNCPEVHCITVQKLLNHIMSCNAVTQCQYPRCHRTKTLLHHYKNCRDQNCPVCVPVKLFVQRKGSHRTNLNSGFPQSGNGSCDYSAEAVRRYTPSVVETSEDLHPSLKRMKIEQPCQSPAAESENPIIPVSITNTPEVLQDVHRGEHQVGDACVPLEFEVPGMKLEIPAPKVTEARKDYVEDCIQNTDDVSVVSNEATGFTKQEFLKAKKEMGQAKQENAAVPAETSTGTKSGKPKIKGVSMTELFTPEQVREHITGLRQWVGQSKAKVEKNQAMELSMNENSCQLCAVEKLNFEPPPIYCSPCGARIKRNAMFYTIGSGDTRHYFCIPCYNEARGDTITVDGTNILKARLEKKKNDEETEEPWVQCDKCEAWQHQICALFNGRRNDGGQAEYTCPNCYMEEVEKGERVPLPQSAVLGAKDLPRTILSDHIESRLFKRLKQERLDRARFLGKSYDEVPGAESLVVRVVSSVDKKLEVKQRFLEIFHEENYPSEYAYKSKVVLLFQKIEGVEVCLFGMYVQEFGAECQQPNHRRVYLSYLDSVKYFRPEIRTVTGEALRTFVYHEILIGYLEYCKLRGFTSCYIWACPPLKGEDYILYCHPEIQKTPKSDKLREWYLSMLRKASKENIVVDRTNLYDHFFVSSGECKAKVTAARLPYFDGDYWPGAAEDIIYQLRQEEDGRKHNKKGSIKRTITKRALKASGQTDLSGNASKDLLLMHRLGETISPMKEDFIMVHLQHACTHCCTLMVSGTRWVCKQCKNFQLCNRCHEVEQNIEERERHPINQRVKHQLYPVEITDVPTDTKDKDEILESEFFDTRQAFLSLCQGNHYQYDTLRRAKHSSMMALYHLHNPTAPAFVITCFVCRLDIETGQGWRCDICPDYDVCNACYRKDRGMDHPHKLTHHPSIAERDAQNKEARQLRVVQLRKMLDLLVHASQCRAQLCQYPNCRKVKGLFRHGMHCKVRASGGCVLCKKMWHLLQLHARACKDTPCNVPRCRDLREHLRRLTQQADSRRRAAVMEMMRQRAAEVAGGSSG